MSVFGNIPLPERGTKGLSDVVESIMKRRMQQKELEETTRAHNLTHQYNMDKKDIEKQKLPGFLNLQNAQANNQQSQANYNSSPYRTDLLKAKIDAEKELAGQRKRGDSGAGTGQKEERFYQELVGKDNPQFKGDPNKIYEASNALRRGKKTLSSGEPINPMSEATRESFNRLTKGGSTNAQVNQMLNAKGAEAELEVLEKFAREGLKEYGNTINNMNPQQIIDTFKNDEKSQTKLGKLIASQALQFEIAQIRNRLAMGQPGITSTQELMHASGQIIDAKFPMLSYKAREAAADQMNKALKEGLKSREKIGIGASNALPNQENNRNSNKESDSEQGLMTIIDSNGKEWKIYRDKLDEAKKDDPGLKVKKDKYGST